MTKAERPTEKFSFKLKLFKMKNIKEKTVPQAVYPAEIHSLLIFKLYKNDHN